MTDIAISQIKSVQEKNILRSPVYLVIFEGEDSKNSKIKKFIATRLDESANYVRVSGIYSNLSEDAIVEKFTSLLTEANKDLYLEMMIPFHRVLRIRNITYKQK